MPPAVPIVDPERNLVLAYAPVRARAALATLWRLDERLGGVVATTSEPMIGRIRLAWWREALERLDQGGPPAEPLLRETAETVLPLGITGAALAEIEAGWAKLLDSDPPDEEAIEAHGRLRGRPLFDLAARLLAGTADAESGMAGEGWALADLARRLSDPPSAALAHSKAGERLAGLRRRRWPIALRPLGALAMLARADALAARPARQGSPSRVARLLLHRLTGR